MRAHSVALDCGTSRSVVGAFDLTPDGDLMLVDYSFCPAMEGGGNGVRFSLPEWGRRGCMVAAPRAHQTLLKCIAVPPVLGAQRARVIRFEAEQIVGAALAEVVWAHVPVAPGVTDCEVVMAMKAAAAEEFCAMGTRCGVEVDRLVPAGWALVRALRYNYPELAGPVVIVWLDGRTAVLVRVERTAASMRLVALPEVERPVAQELAQVGATVESGPDHPPQAPWLDRVAVEIARLVDGTRSSATETEATKVLLGGDERAGPDAVGALAARVAGPVAGFDALRRVRLGPRAAEAYVVSAQLGVAVGLALAAMVDTAVTLLPPARRRAIRFRRHRARWLAGAIVLATIPISLLLWLRQEQLALRLEDAVIAARLVPQQVAERARHDGERERALLHQQLDALAAIRAARVGWLEWLVDLQERLTLVEDVWLDSLVVRPANATTSTEAAALFGRRSVVVGTQTSADPLRVVVTGSVLRRPGGDPLDRVRLLRTSLLESRFVAAVEDERFDNAQAGLLRFSCTLVLRPEVPL